MGRLSAIFLAAALPGTAATAASGTGPTLWENGKARCRLVPPEGDRLGRSTLAHFLGRFYGIELPVARDVNEPGTYLLLGTPENNPSLARLVRDGLTLTRQDFGDEGFQLRTFEKGPSRYVIVYGKTPRALKHGCQELVFYRMPASAESGSVDWPLDVVRKPEFAYRSTYMLPCWSYLDTMASWERALRFNSELALNRTWFWLDGFKIAGHKGAGRVPAPYDTTYDTTASPLSDERNVQKLIDLARDEGMKFYVGGSWLGWWHHGVEVGLDPERGKQYYRDFLKTFRNVAGFFFEPRGEPDGTKVDEGRNPIAEARALQEFVRDALRERPELEFAVSIGSYNSDAYLKFMAEGNPDPGRVYWWWCWGDPVRDRKEKGVDRFPQVVTWHHAMRADAARTHGSRLPPEPRHRGLAGVATTQEASSGWGNFWDKATGIWPKLDGPLDLDPYSMAYFYLQYYFRERCWDLDLSDAGFAALLRRRLFDAGAPADAGERYAELSRLVLRVYDGGARPGAAELAPIRTLLDRLRARALTPRAKDTLSRMEDALRRLGG